MLGAKLNKPVKEPGGEHGHGYADRSGEGRQLVLGEKKIPKIEDLHVKQVERIGKFADEAVGAGGGGGGEEERDHDEDQGQVNPVKIVRPGNTIVGENNAEK